MRGAWGTVIAIALLWVLAAVLDGLFFQVAHGMEALA